MSETKTMLYPVTFEPEEDGGFSVYVPDLPGCASQGDTLAESWANINEAIALHIEGMKMDGLPVSEPGSDREEQERREDEADRRLADEAVAEMRAKGETPIAWEDVKQRLGLDATGSTKVGG